MFKTLLIALILCAPAVYAQDPTQDMEYIDTANTGAVPFSVPLYVDTEGNLNILFNNLNTTFSYRPLVQVYWKKSKSDYIKPITRSAFAFTEQKTDMEWIQVKRLRWEAGLGLGVMTNSLPFSVGLTPYKGSRQVITRNTKTRDEVTANPKLPKELSEMEEWSTGDRGSFQTYGGVQIQAGVNYSIINVVTVGLTIQNLFSVVIKKEGENNIRLTIAEENLNKRKIESGVGVAKATLNFFNGKRLVSDFIFQLDNPLHHKLFALAIKGKLDQVQAKLPKDAQKMQWKGSERIGYIGIPTVMGKYFSRSNLELENEGVVENLDIRSRNSSGLFLPLRNHNKLVYQTEKDLTLFWYSEMNKANEEVLTRKFLTPGKILGARGFDNVLPAGTQLGSTLSQMGISFTRKEVESVTPELLEEILVNFKARCVEMKQECAQTKKFNKLSKKLRGYLSDKWEEIRDNLGFIMLDEPALIFAYVKTIKAKKTIYFKFLNETYQSMEGLAPIEI